MNRDETNALAKQAGIWIHPGKDQARFGLSHINGDDGTPQLQRFADLVIEMCAKACEATPVLHDGRHGYTALATQALITAAIRARKDSA